MVKCRGRICEICGVRERNRPGFFSNFPLNEQRCKLWVQIIGNEDLAHIPIEKLHINKHVCGDHFLPKDFNKKGNRLRKRAIPKLMIYATPLKDDLLKDFPLHVASKSGKNTTVHHISTLEKVEIHIDHLYTNEKPLSFTAGSNTNYLATLEKVEGHVDHSYFKSEEKKEKTPSTADVPPANKEEKLAGNLYSYEDGDAIRTDTCDNDDLPPSPGEEFTTNIVSEIGENIELENFKVDKIFSWQKSELIEADDPEDPKPAAVPEQPKIPEDLTLSLFCEAESPFLQPTPSESVAVVPEDVEYWCKDCAAVIDGFSWWCVPCACGALCDACALRPPHDAHHVLRAPPAATHNQTQAVLAVIREQLLKENLLSLHGTDDDGVKVEVKQEPEERPPSPPLPAATPDPLAMELHTDPLTEESYTDPFTEESHTDPFDVESQPDTLNEEFTTNPFDLEPHTEPLDEELDTDPFTVESYPEDPDPINVEPHLEARTDESLDEETINHHPFKRPRLMDSQTFKTNTVTSKEVLKRYIVKVPARNQGESQTVQTASNEPGISQDVIPATSTDPSGSQTVLNVTTSDPSGSQTVVQVTPSDLKRLQTFLQSTTSDPRISQDMLDAITRDLKGLETILQVIPSDPSESQTAVQENPTYPIGSETVLHVDASDLDGSELSESVLHIDPSDLKRLQDLLTSDSTGSETGLQVDPSNLSGSQIISQDDPSDQLESQTVLQLDLDDLTGLQDFLSACSNDPTLSQTVLQIDRDDLRRLQDVLQGPNSDPFRSETVQQVDPSNRNELQTSLQDDPTDHLGSQTVLQLPSDLKVSQTAMQIDSSNLRRLPDVLLTTDPRIRTASQSLSKVTLSNRTGSQSIPKATLSSRTVSQSLPKTTLSDSTGSKSLLKATPTDSTGSQSLLQITPSDRTGSQSLLKVTPSDRTALPNIIARNRGASQYLLKGSLTKSQAPDKIQPGQLMMSRTPQKVKHSDLSGSKTRQKSQPSILRKSQTVLKLKKVQNISKVAPVLRLRQNDPEGSRIEIPQTIPRGKSVPLKVTSEPQPTQTVIINLDDELDECDVEFLEEEILDSDSEDGLDKEIEHTGEYTVRNIASEVVENIGDLKENRDKDEYSDTNSSCEDIQVDKNTRNEADSVRDFVDSDVDNSDLDKDYRVEADTIEDDSMDETDVEDIAGRGVRSTRNATKNSEKGPSKATLVKDYRVEEENIPEDSMADTDVEDIAGKSVGMRTRNATKTSEKGPSEAILRMLTSKAVVQLEPLTSMDVKKWTASRKPPRKD